MRRPIPLVIAILCTAAVATSPLAAQDPRLSARFDAGTVSALQRSIAAAADRGLPTEPLIQKALEGASKGAPPDRIEHAVQVLAERLATARSALGETASTAELVAAASALYVGTQPATLRELRGLRPQGSLAMPLVALTFFVQRGVTADASVHWVESLMGADLVNEDWLRLQQLIDDDIRSGAPPAAAGATRVEALLRRQGGGGRDR